MSACAWLYSTQKPKSDSLGISLGEEQAQTEKALAQRSGEVAALNLVRIWREVGKVAGGLGVKTGQQFDLFFRRW